MNSQKIKNCPFCGGKAHSFQIPENNAEERRQHPKWDWNYPGMWVIGCEEMECFGNINNFSRIFTTEGNAIRAWNRRA